MLRTRRLGIVAAGILLLALAGLSPSAPSRGAGLVEGLASAWKSAAGAGTVAAVPSGDPRLDENGYTVWGGPVDGHWCVPLTDIIKYPIDLGGQDPNELGDTSLDLVFDEGYMYFGNPIDPVWTVKFNGQPVGTISGPWYHPFERYRNSVSIPITPSLVIDGENDIYLSSSEPPVGDIGAPG